jgi:hypothetical protein
MSRWPRGTLYLQKLANHFADKRRSLGRYFLYEMYKIINTDLISTLPPANWPLCAKESSTYCLAAWTNELRVVSRDLQQGVHIVSSHKSQHSITEDTQHRLNLTYPQNTTAESVRGHHNILLLGRHGSRTDNTVCQYFYFLLFNFYSF